MGDRRIAVTGESGDSDLFNLPFEGTFLSASPSFRLNRIGASPLGEADCPLAPGDCGLLVAAEDICFLMLEDCRSPGRVAGADPFTSATWPSSMKVRLLTRSATRLWSSAANDSVGTSRAFALKCSLV